MRTLTRWRLPVLAAAGLAIGAAAGGGTFALWNGGGDVAGATITAGDLDASAQSATWWETSPDVEAATHEIVPDEFLIRPGDTTRTDFGFAVTSDGDNMRAAIGIAWTTAPDLPAGVTGTYTLLDAAEAPVSTAVPLGQDTADLGVITTTASAEYTIRVDLDFTGASDRFGPTSAVQTADLGEFAVDLTQVRTGGEFE